MNIMKGEKVITVLGMNTKKMFSIKEIHKKIFHVGEKSSPMGSHC